MRQKHNECEDCSPVRQVAKPWIYPMPTFDQTTFSYRSVLLFPSTNVFPSCSNSTRASQRVQRRCVLPNKANVAFAFPFVSPQFIPRFGSPTPSSVSIRLPFACPILIYFIFIIIFHFSIVLPCIVRQHFFFIWPHICSLSLDVVPTFLEHISSTCG